MNKGQKQWRHGFMTGIKRASGIDLHEQITGISSNELEQLRRDSSLVSVMREMGAFNRESRPGGIYWPGAEQAFAILADFD